MIRDTRLFLLLIMLFGVFTASGQERVVEVAGEAEIIGNNALSARPKAIANAFRNAVEQGIGVYVKSQTVVQNFQLISDNMYAQAEGYVSNHEILEEGQQDKLYVVKIRATVNTAKIGTDLKTLGILKNLMGDPKIMSLIQEISVTPSGRTIIEDAASSIALEEELNIAGFTLVDRDQVNQIRAREIAAMGDFLVDRIYDDPAALDRIREAAQAAGAQYLLMGSGIIEPKRAPGDVFMSTATFKVKIVDASTGEKIALTQMIESGAGNTQAAANLNAGARAGKVSSEKIIPQIINDWQEKLQGIPFLVKLYGVKSYAREGRKFENTVKTMAGVASSVKRAWDGAAGRLELEVKFKGSGDDLINAILDAVSPIPGFENIDIQDQSGSNINFKL